MSDQPILILVAGINGAGKTTFYYNHIKPWLDSKGIRIPFVNADELERAQHPNEIGQHSIEMGKLAAVIRDQYLLTGQSFVTETVFSHESKIQLIDKAQNAGFKVMLNHVHVDSPELAYMRVQTRISRGGHAVPKDRLFARYQRSISHIIKASQKANSTYVWDNSKSAAFGTEKHRFIMALERGAIIKLGTKLPLWVEQVYKQQFAERRAEGSAAEGPGSESARGFQGSGSGSADSDPS